MSSSDLSDSSGSGSGALSTCDIVADELRRLRTLEEWILGLVIGLLFIALVTWILWCWGARLRHKRNRKHRGGLIDGHDVPRQETHRRPPISESSSEESSD